MRQPLYNKDFCQMIIYCIENQPDGGIYDVVGEEKVDYIDIIRTIKRVKQLKNTYYSYSLRTILCVIKNLCRFQS
jgi:dTDP-D-glucose 4,6-dehydratase